MGGNLKKIEAWFKTILKITINEMFKNHIETANTTVGGQTNSHFHIANIHNKINWGRRKRKKGKSNVQIPKINTLFIWIFYKILFKTKSLFFHFASMCKLKVVSFFF